MGAYELRLGGEALGTLCLLTLYAHALGHVPGIQVLHVVQILYVHLTLCLQRLGIDV